MKKKILLFTILAFTGYTLLTSESNGPANSAAGNRTGAKGSPTTCSGSGCHSAATGPTVTITVDSNGTTVTKYKAGASYKIKIHGSLSGSSNQFFGFSFTAVSGTGTSQVAAGSYGSSFPGGIARHPLSGLDFIEHSVALRVATAGTYDTSFTWKAPTTGGTGTITMYCSLNAVNGNGFETGGDVSGNTNITLSEILNVGVKNVLNNININTYPNPVSNDLYIAMSNAENGNYTFNIFDVTGRNISATSATVNSNNFTANINTGNWARGIYFVQIAKDGNTRSIQVVK